MLLSESTIYWLKSIVKQIELRPEIFFGGDISVIYTKMKSPKYQMKFPQLPTEIYIITENRPKSGNKSEIGLITFIILDIFKVVALNMC